jgi:membrane-bound ClpP family serine protease
MNHPFIIYLLIGFFAYVALGLFSFFLRREDSSDEFLFGAIDIFLLPLWPLVLPYTLIKVLREDRSVAVDSSASGKQDDMVGVRAVTVTELRPSGSIRIGSDTYDALSECGIIPDGEEVVVMGRDGLRVLVKNVAEQGAGADR